MKVLLIGNYYPATGGAERALHELCFSLKKEKVDFSILTPGIKGKMPKDAFSAERSWTFIKSYDKIQKKRVLEYIMNYSSLIPGILKGKEIIKEENIDIIHAHFGLSHGLIGVFLKKIYKKPLILTLHGGGFNFNGKRKIFRPLTKFVLENSDEIIAVSESMKIKARKETSKKITVIPNSVFPNKFHNKGNKFVLSIGRLAKLKSFDTLVKAASDESLKNVGFKIIGDGPEKENLTKMISKLNLNDFILPGFLDHKKTIELISNCSVFCLPSKSEGMPLTILEAMACGKPVIGTRVGGIPELIKEGENGFLINIGDDKKLAQLIKKIISNKKLMDKLGKNSRKKVIEKFNWEKNVKKIKKVYLQSLRK